MAWVGYVCNKGATCTIPPDGTVEPRTAFETFPCPLVCATQRSTLLDVCCRGNEHDKRVLTTSMMSFGFACFLGLGSECEGVSRSALLEGPKGIIDVEPQEMLFASH